MELIFASQNPNKIEEINALLPENISVRGVAELGQIKELPETHETLQENALEKAAFVHKKFKVNCFSEDTGLEIKALNGEPGVYSARYAGEGKAAADNINLVLKKMEGKSDRSAKFRTVISLILENKKYFFEGEVSGEILNHPDGEKGFGYDPIFMPAGFNKSFAHFTTSEKNEISHRARAFKKMKNFLIKKEK